MRVLEPDGGANGELMAGRETKSEKPKATLPRPGDAFLMPLGNGLFAACRVLSKSRTSRGSVIVAVSSWVGDETVDVTDPRLREVYVATHHGWGPNTWACVTVSGPVPDTFRLLGTITPSEGEGLRIGIWTQWNGLARERLLQWRWDNDRDALLKEEEEAREKWQRDQADEAIRRQRYLDSLTLQTLRKKRRFTQWQGDRPSKAIAECRKLFITLIDELIALGPKPKKRAVGAAIRRCVEKLNELDGRYDGFIEAGEREALCAEIDEMSTPLGYAAAMAWPTRGVNGETRCTGLFRIVIFVLHLRSSASRGSTRQSRLGATPSAKLLLVGRQWDRDTQGFAAFRWGSRNALHRLAERWLNYGAQPLSIVRWLEDRKVRR